MEYWKILNTDGTISSVESHSYPHEVPNGVRITKRQYDEFMASLPEPEPPKPPDSTHLAELVSIDVSKARPARVKRVWQGNEYFSDCFVIETVKDQYLAGNIAIGDHLLVHFDPIGEQIVTAKVFKSWE